MGGLRVTAQYAGRDCLKYRFAYVIRGVYNEAGKGDHRHFGKRQSEYMFTTPEALLSDFHEAVKVEFLLQAA